MLKDKLAVGECPLYDKEKVIQVEGLGHEVVGPVVHGLHGSLYSTVSCEDDHRDILVVRCDLL